MQPEEDRSSRTHDGGGDRAPTDPVCGMRVDPRAPKGGTYAFEGETYYFCNARCREQFIAGPPRYLRPAPPPPAPVAAAEGTYTCPMHPEVVRDRPGSCPICGMALEPRAV